MAGAIGTRTLVLGVTQLFQPVNGYQIRRELLSWGVEDWAELKAGSIYSMLTTLEKQELVTRWDLPDGSRSVAVYATTEAGRTEFGRLVRGLLDGTLGTDTESFQTGMSFLPLLSRAEGLVALRTRQKLVADHAQELSHKIALAPQNIVPPHVQHMLVLDFELRRKEAEWLADFVTMIEAGALQFSDEAPSTWAPPAEDAGWEMVEQSRRYRDQIAALTG